MINPLLSFQVISNNSDVFIYNYYLTYTGFENFTNDRSSNIYDFKQIT